MLRYTLRRLLGAIPTLFLVIVLAFLLVHAAPGGPFDDERALPAEIEANIAAAYHLDEPLPMQFARYLGGDDEQVLGSRNEGWVFGYHAGNAADSRMRATASRRGYRLDSRARRLAGDDYRRFGLIVAMDEDNYRDILAGHPGEGAEVVRMVDFCSVIEADEVPDPYYGGPSGFEHVLDILDDACSGLLRLFDDAD